MKIIGSLLSFFATLAIGAGNVIFFRATTTCSGLGCLGQDAGAMLFIGGGVALGVLAWLLGILRYMTGGPGGGLPAAMTLAPLLPGAVFLAITLTSLRPYFVSHFSTLVGVLLVSLLVTPLLALLYSLIPDQKHYWQF